MLLKNLTQLQDLVLFQVKISSRLPNSLLNLSSLAIVDLTETGLLGDLPYEIFQLPKLQILSLGSNYNMTGNLLKVKWGCNSSLEELDLSYNQFSGPLPESLGNLTRITHLVLTRNGFTGRFPGQGNNRNGEIPNFFAKLLKLEYLGLGANNFSAVPFP
ncbi:hypothetical protein Vadar_032443 [Vaccinium darrowii]|uniref:Uncharacterized protein n=1 Tax=Vaccinium darrowii TaxID=229202 RepID=A0ACB7YBF4_9ERIC|nr:hypothetical protein Vadar_032443 [Vaccinium darrowii]